MKEHLPWEGVSKPIYKAQSPKPQKQWVRIGGGILAFVMLIAGIVSRFYLLILLGVLYLIALIMKKYTVVTNRGVEIYYQMYITTHYDIWKWSELSYVMYEDRTKAGLTALLFNRGERVKRLYFKNEDAVEIVQLAKEMHSGILTGEAADYRHFTAKDKIYSNF